MLDCFQVLVALLLSVQSKVYTSSFQDDNYSEVQRKAVVHLRVYSVFRGLVFRLDSGSFVIFLPCMCGFGLLGMSLVLRPASDRGVAALTHPQTDVEHVGER
jgi:hypothetical protein